MDIFTPAVATIRGQHVSSDGSTKFLWQLGDGHTVESVFFRFQEQFYACISSQVGCNVGCPFCATGQQRVLRNLTAQEIVAQVVDIEGIVRGSGSPWPLDHIAFAGMGEPLLNFDAVVQAAEYLRARRLASTVSLSTSGIVPKMYELAECAELGVNKLFVSLHATTKELRDRLVPTNKKYSLTEVLEAARFFAERTGTKVTATYLLFAGLNDTDGDLYRLLDLLNPTLFVVQLSVVNCARAFSRLSLLLTQSKQRNEQNTTERK